MEIDDDGFSVGAAAPPSVALKRPPITAEVPKFFAGCTTNDEAIVKMINKLNEPFSVGQHGMDEFYQRIANALILILANQGDIAP